ncbi:hypothetical protein LTR27_002843 [Elasticomyces elasticus]|nr:hypothetical protein LTR27_002843 [Elasticomyces elasticus]
MATTTSVTAPQPTSRLMALPAELRIHIYEWLFAGLTIRTKSIGARGSDGTHLSLLKYHVPEILLCSRQIYQETIGMYYSLSVVEAANDSQSLGTVLSSIPEETYRILQGVRIDCTVPNEYWDSVLEHCQGDHGQYDCVQVGYVTSSAVWNLRGELAQANRLRLKHIPLQVKIRVARGGTRWISINSLCEGTLRDRGPEYVDLTVDEDLTLATWLASDSGNTCINEYTGYGRIDKVVSHHQSTTSHGKSRSALQASGTPLASRGFILRQAYNCNKPLVWAAE